MEKNENHKPWHILGLEQVLSTLGVNDAGLTQAQAKERLSKFGPNKLPEQPATTIWQIVARQFYSPLIYILLVAAIFSVFIGDFKDAGFIAAVLIINASIGTYQEWKAEQSSLALKKLLQINSAVLREEEVHTLAAEELVPGDILLLESGNRVPADVRLISQQNLQVDESLLTGESVAVEKDATWKGPENSPVGDRGNMLFAGSTITLGRGKGVVVATGADTSVGQLALDVGSSTVGKSPLVERMERFSNFIAVGTLVIATSIGLLATTMGRYEVSEMFMFVIALAVAAIPEGLPVAMTVALAIATHRMARRGVIVRRLTAVEGLGSCTLIATDKTGTLTVNELTVREVRLLDGNAFTVTGEGFTPEGDVLSSDGAPMKAGRNGPLDAVARAGVLTNEADLHPRGGEWVARGDAVDLALLAFGGKLGWRRDDLLEELPLISEIHFESERQFAATFHRENGNVRILVKGAPERILEMCGNRSDVSRLEAMALDMASHGFRVLALAEGQTANEIDPQDPPEPANLTFLGFVGMIDPLRPGVRKAVEQCHLAGVEAAMITGDHRLTALAIARDLDMAHDESQVITGPELLDMSPDELTEIVGRVRVFARVAPRQKLEIVEAARRAGHYVAVTGDGVNDAPALRVSNIGVAMGKHGTDVAREAAELVISDDNFATIVAGIEEGRIAYNNIRKVVFQLLSTGGAELLMVLLTVMFGLPLPLLPVQLLWLNLVTNGIQGVALAFEPGEGDTLRQKPRPPEEPIFNRLMIERMCVSVAVMGGMSFGVFYWLKNSGYSIAQAQNIVLLLMVLFENFHVGNSRSETKSAFVLSPLRSPILLLGVLSAFSIHLVSMYIPFMQDVLGSEPVPLTTWVVVVALATSVVPANELYKWLWKRRGRER